LGGEGGFGRWEDEVEGWSERGGREMLLLVLLLSVIVEV